MRRKVIGVENYINSHANGTQGSNILTLECGHKERRKGSVKIPDFVHCRECKQWMTGGYGSKSMGTVVETWDAEKQMPVFTDTKPNKPDHRQEEAG